MTAKNGPFEIIGEAAWANPGKIAKSIMDFALDSVVPTIAKQMGAPSGMDKQSILGMLGLGNTDVSTLRQPDLRCSYRLDRSRQWFVFPGLVAIVKSDNPDLQYIVTGMMDSISLAMPYIPMKLKDFGDKDAKTWVFNDPSIPITPTIAWTKGYFVKSLWREDALKARDALEQGTLLSTGDTNPANFRLQVNRQELFHGIADVLFEIPAPYVAAGGGAFELGSQLSKNDERLWMESINHGDYTEGRCKFSIGMFETVAPVFAYIMKGMTNQW